MAENQSSFLMYRGKPLVRKGNTIYYGNAGEPFIIMFSIASTNEVHGVKIADKVIVQLLNTDPNINPLEAIVKRTEKKGLWAAVDIGSIWLQRALSE